MSIFLLFIAFSATGRMVANKVKDLIPLSQNYVLVEEIPLYDPDLNQFATLYLYSDGKDTFSVITGTNQNSRPVYEFGHGTYRFIMYSRKYGGYKNRKVVYTGFSTFFIYDGSSYYDTRFFKTERKDYVSDLFKRSIVFKDYSIKWNMWLNNTVKLDEYSVIDSVPAYLWSYGCSPTASAMILGYWDKKGYGRLIDYYFDHYDVVLNDTVYNVPNVQRELAIYMNADTTTGYTDWAPISTGTQDCANMGNGYSFVSEWLYDTIVYDTACAYDTAYMYLKQEIDAGRPVHWAVGNYLDPYGRIIEHSTCAVGYQVSGADTFVILHNTWDTGTWAWPLYTTDSTYIALYNVIPGGAQTGNINIVNTQSYIVNNLHFKLRLFFDDPSAVYRAELLYSMDNALTWNSLGDITSDTVLVMPVDFGGAGEVRFMVKTYDAGGNLVSAETDYTPASVVYPEYQDGLFEASAFETISPEPRTVNILFDTLYIGTTYGISRVIDQDTVLTQDSVFDSAVFSSAQYGSFIIYGEYSEGFSIFDGDSEIYHDTALSYVVDVALSDSIACVFERNSGLRLIRYREGFLQDTVESSGAFFMTGAVFGNYLYIGTLRGGLLVYDINSDTFVDTVGSGRVYDVELSSDDSMLYVLYVGYFKVYDISQPRSPQKIDSVGVSGTTHIRGNGKSVYVMEGTDGMEIYSFSPNGYFRSRVYNIGKVQDVAVCDSVLYVITAEGLVVKFIYTGSEVKEVARYSTFSNNSVLINSSILKLDRMTTGLCKIYGLDGRLYLKRKINGGILYVGDLPAGVYVIRYGKTQSRLVKIN